MKFISQCIALALATLIMAAPAGAQMRIEAPARVETQGPYHLRTMFTNSHHCLETVTKGVNSWVQMAPCSPTAARQQWRVESLGDGLSRVRVAGREGDLCLRVVDDGINDGLAAAPCGRTPAPVEQWKIEASARTGYSRLRSPFTGDGKCLDIVNDGKNNQLDMADCGDYSGQYWGFARVR
ncbi:MAG TPA: RICIN domain-containing protein [Burkholderiales bacterium]|jgi:hypothetical protein